MTAGQGVPQVLSQVAPAVHRATGGVTNFFLVEEGDSSRLVDAGTGGSGDLLQLALSAHSGVLEAVVPTHIDADHTGFAERARTKADALVWVHQADAAVAKGTQTES